MNYLFLEFEVKDSYFKFDEEYGYFKDVDDFLSWSKDVKSKASSRYQILKNELELFL